jgi:hypothetical protein
MVVTMKCFALGCVDGQLGENGVIQEKTPQWEMYIKEGRMKHKKGDT